MSQLQLICRTCAKECSELIPLTTTIVYSSFKHKLSDMYIDFTNLHCTADDQLPQKMCVTCTNKLNNAFFYRKQCFQAEEILKNQLIKFTFVDTQQTKNHTVFSENPSFNDVSDSNENEIYSVENTVMKPIEDIDPQEKREKLMVIPIAKPKRKVVKFKNDRTINSNNDISNTQQYETIKNYKTLPILSQQKVNIDGLCNICGELISGPYEKYNIHMRKHKESEKYETQKLSYSYIDNSNKNTIINYKCEVCDELFDKRKKLKNHFLHRHKPKSHFCDVCGKGFLAPSALKYHYLTHTGNLPYECNTCGKRSRSKSDHAIHVRFHTGERPFLCQFSFCEKAFPSQSARKEHEGIHVSDKLYECTICSEKFQNARKYKVHKNRHRTHTCLICDRTFKCAKYVLTHMRTHPEFKEIVCSYCGKQFREQKYLEIHARTCQHKFLNAPIDTVPIFLGE